MVVGSAARSTPSFTAGTHGPPLHEVPGWHLAGHVLTDGRERMLLLCLQHGQGELVGVELELEVLHLALLLKDFDIGGIQLRGEKYKKSLLSQTSRV